MAAQSISGFGGARRAHGVRTDEMWAAKQRKNVDAFRAIYGHDVRVHDAPRRSRRPIYANDGRWVLDCDCHAGVIVDLTWGIARCHECGAIYRRHNLLIPSNAMEIETALLTLYPQRRQSALRDWRPGQTLDDLKGRHFSWTTPRTWVTGEVVTASIGNIHWRDNLNELRAGGIAIASQAALDFLYASSGSQFARVAKGSGLQVVRLNSGATAYEFYTPASAGIELVSYTTTAAASVTISSLDLTTHLAYHIIVKYVTANSGSVLTAQVNADATAGRHTYLNSVVTGSGTTITQTDSTSWPIVQNTGGANWKNGWATLDITRLVQSSDVVNTNARYSGATFNDGSSPEITTGGGAFNVADNMTSIVFAATNSGTWNVWVYKRPTS